MHQSCRRFWNMINSKNGMVVLFSFNEILGREVLVYVRKILILSFGVLFYFTSMNVFQNHIIRMRERKWRALFCRSFYWKLPKKHVTVRLLWRSRLFRHLSIQITANCAPVQRNSFHYLVLVFHAESDSVNNLYQWENSLLYICLCYRKMSIASVMWVLN